MIEVGKALYGSQNYGLDVKESDKDYKIFCAPSFIDLYENRTSYTLPRESDEHLTPIDVRSFCDKVVKGNATMVECIYSTMLNGDKRFISWCESARKLYKNHYLLFVWDTFFHSTYGMVNANLKKDKSRKTITRAFYFYNFLYTIVQNNFVLLPEFWRENDWNVFVREMRLDSSMPLLSADEIFQDFNELDIVSQRKKNHLIDLLSSHDKEMILFDKKMLEWQMVDYVGNLIRSELCNTV